MDLELYQDFANQEKHHWWFMVRRNFVTFFAEKYGVKDKDSLNILEIGCGTGGGISTWEALAPNVNLDLVEPEDWAREYIKETQGLDALKLYLPDDELPFEKEKYDLIIMLDVLEHIEEDGKTLKVLQEYLKPDGLLILTVPAYQFLWCSHDEKNHHKRRYTKTHLVELAKQENYIIKTATYINMFLFPAVASVYLYFKYTKKWANNVNISGGGNSLLNKLFYTIFNSEVGLSNNVSLPFGSSVFTVLQKPTDVTVNNNDNNVT